MRLILLPFALLLASQAAAQQRPAPPEITLDTIGDALSNPAVQGALAGLVGAFADTVLDTGVGPLAHYSDQIRERDTLGDLVRRDDPDFDARLRRQAHGAIAATGQAARDGAAMSRELAKTADRLRDLVAATNALTKSYARQR